MAKPFVIMFVCTGNTCRSPMAQAALQVLLEKRRPGKSEVMSAGTAAAEGFPATMYGIEAAKIWDCDLSDHSSRPLTRDLIDRADLIFGMSPSHVKEVLRLQRSAADKTYLLKNFPDHNPDGESIEDPIGQPLEDYNATFLEIGEYLGKYIDEIVQLIDGKNDGA